MSIQGNVNQGINMAALLYRMSPAYEKKQIKTRAFEQMKGAQKAESEVVQGEGLRDKSKMAFEQKKLLRNIAATTNPTERQQYKDMIELQHERAERIANKFRDARETLLGMDLKDKEKAQLESLRDSMAKDYQEYLENQRDYQTQMAELDDRFVQDQIEQEELAAQEAQNP